ncbi:tetratricopeptide repeat protein [Niabella hirudinis]|uniref:tetratricopeptide repeat-containing sensor histidine kinase n=1 Tax=Niabella hirudinis TaxID=1285929 RepID=UPI003EBAA9E8
MSGKLETDAASIISKADSLYNLNALEGMRYYDSLALNFADEINNPEYSGRAYFLHAKYLAAVQNFKEANQFYQKALQVFYKKKNNLTTAQVYNDLGFSYGETGALDKQIDCYLQAIRIYEQRNEAKGLGQSMSNLSTAYFNLEKDEEAFDYALKTLAIREKQGDPADMALSYGNLANMYVQTGRDDLANKYINMGMDAAQKSGDEERLAQVYITKSLLLNKEKKIVEALDMELKAIAIYKKLNNLGIASNRYIAAAFYSNMLGDSASADRYFTNAIDMASSLQNKTVMRNGYQYLSNFYSAHKNHEKALIAYKKYISLRDSISNSETDTKIAMLQSTFDFEKKEFEINQLQIQQKIKQLEIEKQKALLTQNVAEAERKQKEIDLLSKTKELQTETLLRKEEELERQKLMVTNNQQKLLIAEQEKTIQDKQIKTQTLIRNLLLGLTALLILLAVLGFNRYKLKRKLEQQASILSMRNHISENLHDDIGASLSNINILNQLARNHITTPAIADSYLEKSIEDIQQVSENISDIVWSVNPKYDDLAQLLIRVKRYAADMFDGRNINFEINFEEQISGLQLDIDKKRNFYLFCKETINNLVKHSQATLANIHLFCQQQDLVLRIKDNGKGFDLEKVNRGNGLINMHKRANALLGILSIQSDIGKGTEVLLRFPIT